MKNHRTEMKGYPSFLSQFSFVLHYQDTARSKTQRGHFLEALALLRLEGGRVPFLISFTNIVTHHSGKEKNKKNRNPIILKNIC